jgi:hypothetical protein
MHIQLAPFSAFSTSHSFLLRSLSSTGILDKFAIDYGRSRITFGRFKEQQHSTQAQKLLLILILDNTQITPMTSLLCLSLIRSESSIGHGIP